MSKFNVCQRFGPSTVGAINLISGQTNGVVKYTGGTGAYIGNGNGGLTLIAIPDDDSLVKD